MTSDWRRPDQDKPHCDLPRDSSPEHDRSVPPGPDPSPATTCAASLFLESARRAIATGAVCNVLVGHGPRIAAVLGLLVHVTGMRAPDWTRIHVFAADAHRPGQRATQTLPPLHMHRIPPGGGLGAAGRYEQMLRAHFSLRPGELPRFDLALLEFGPRGAVAGMRPHDRTRTELTRLVVPGPGAGRGPAVTLPVINAARRLVLLGASAARLNRSLLNPQGELVLISPSTARSIGAATPATVRAHRISQCGP